MSTMNDNDHDNQSSGNGISKSIGSPSSPSSLSSASSTSSHSSSSSNPQLALQAAVQALLHQNSGQGLLTSLEQNKPSNIQAMQQQQQLNQLLASIASAQQQNSLNSNPSALLNSLMQQQFENNSNNSQNSKENKKNKLNVKTKNQGSSRSIKGNSVSPPGTSSTHSCSDDQDIQSPSNSEEMCVKNEPGFIENNKFNVNICTKNKSKSNDIKNEDLHDYDQDLDRSTNSSASVLDLQNSQVDMHNDDDDEDLDELDDYETSFNRDPKRHRNHSTSSPTRSTSSNQHSRSTSPSTTSYHDSPAAFPNLNPLESATAMLGGLNCTPNGLSSFLDTSLDGSGSGKRGRGQNGNLSSSVEGNKKIKPVPQDKKDDAYWERRRKNNEAAKRSRDLRRQKEDSIAVKATILEQENLKLKAQVTILKAELSKLHFMLYNR